MADKSSYLQYLPPVLWEHDPPAPEFSLGAVLRIFEKVLTGIADDVPAHPPLTAEIAGLDRIFDPWKTPERFLPWLASWVALQFPTLQDTDLWDEYQRRKVTSEIAQIYRLRGLKAGLDQYLDLYAVGRTRPRVALDDGRRLLVVTPRPGTLAPVAGLVTQGPVVTRDGGAVGRAHPSLVRCGGAGRRALRRGHRRSRAHSPRRSGTGSGGSAPMAATSTWRAPRRDRSRWPRTRRRRHPWSPWPCVARRPRGRRPCSSSTAPVASSPSRRRTGTCRRRR